MDARQFLAEFGHIANAPGGVTKLRELVLSLAVSGRLVPQNSKEQSAINWLSEVDNQKIKLAREGKIHRPSKVAEITSDDMPFAPPSGWEFARLGRITTKIGSGSTPRGGSQVYVTKGIPFLRSQNVWNDGIRLDDVAYITHDMNENMGGTSVKTNDLLLNSTGASLGRCAMVPANFGPANVSQHVCIIRLVDVSARQYLHLCLQSPLLQKMIWGRQVGMAREGLSKKVLEQFEIPIPPIEEQSRIVAKVDELMALCDTLEEQQQSRRKLQNALRQATLQALANAQNPHELQAGWARLEANFGRLFREPEDVFDLSQAIRRVALQGLLTSRIQGETVSVQLTELGSSSGKVGEAEADWPIPSNWMWARCGWLGEARLGKMLDASKNKGTLTPYLRNINVRWRHFELRDVLRMRVEDHELPRITIKRGDVVICEGGEPGRAAIWDRDDEFVIQKALHRYRCGSDLLPEYLLLCLEHDFHSGRLARYYTGATIKHLTGKALAEYSIPLPPVEEQSRILAAIEKLSAGYSDLKDQLNKRTRYAELLVNASVAALTGIAIEQGEHEPVKVPQTELIAKLRLGQAPGVKAQAPLATILARHDGELSAQELWQRFGGEIDAFYAQLKTEVAHGWVEEPAVAEMREKVEKAEA
ncbi:MAG: restriction endonuclease subunit S [Pseudomonadota bacterium]